MNEQIYSTESGNIHYYINKKANSELTLVFLPGLTADHRLFDKQIAFFEDKYNILVWDAPGHAASRPFNLNFTLADKAKWLDAIFQAEGIEKPVIIGQSMGGYVGQIYSELFPNKLQGFVSIDSAPLQRKYMTDVEIWMLKHTERLYRAYPWNTLVKSGAKGCAETRYGRDLMEKMLRVYDNDRECYIRLVSAGYRMLAEAIEADLPYEIRCPVILICGEKDKAGSAKRYNKKWHEVTGYPIYWIRNAGHNSNTDSPEEINGIIGDFLSGKLSFRRIMKF